MSKETAEIRDQLGNDPDVFQVLNANYYEEFGVEEQPLKIETRTKNNGFILGHSTKGILGSGGSNVLGPNDGALVLEAVVNNNDIYIERFAFTDFKDASNTTATWDVTNLKITF